jgi:hypothetical protein
MILISKNSNIGMNICFLPQNGAQNSHLCKNTIKSSSSEMVRKKNSTIFLILLDLWQVRLD